MRSVIIFLFLVGGLCAQDSDFQRLMGKDSSEWSHVSRLEDVLALEKFESFYENNKNYLNEQHSDYRVPPILHIIYLSGVPLREEALKSWVSLHPGWKVKLWTLKKTSSPIEGIEVCDARGFPFLFSREAFERAGVEEKGDILRFEILYQEGGLCVETRTKCLKSFEALHRGFDFYCGLHPPHPPIAGKNITSSHEILGARPFHPVIGKALEFVRERGVGHARKKEEISWILTEALVERLGEDQNVDIVLPASYFFAKEGMTPLFAQCPLFDERLTTKSVERRLRATHWLFMIGIFLAFTASFLYIFHRKKLKKE